MVQIITVSIENAKLYDRAYQSLRDAKQREEMLAAMNSALQTISVSTVLNVNDIVHKFVKSAAKLVQTEMSIFFQCTAEREHLIVLDAYEAQKQQINWHILMAWTVLTIDMMMNCLQKYIFLLRTLPWNTKWRRVSSTSMKQWRKNL